MKNKETLDALGMTTDQADVLMDRCQSGEMNFVDFLSIMCFLTQISSDKSMVSSMAEVADDSETSSMVERLGGYKSILDSLTPEERSDPALLLTEGEDGRARVARVARELGRAESVVDQFLLEFRTMRKMLMKLSTKDMDRTTTEMALERAEDLTKGKSRKMRRQVKGSTRKKKAEWLSM